MRRTIYSPIPFLLALVASAFSAASCLCDEPARAKARVPWTTSRIRGTPEAPPPYRIENTTPKLSFVKPLILVNLPGSDRLFVGEQGGKILSFVPGPNASKTDLFLDVSKDLKSWQKDPAVKDTGDLYGLAFHPKFDQNRYCYVCYVLNQKKGDPLPQGTRVSRFKVLETDPPKCDPASEEILITWLAGGHNGGCLVFGPDGYLYISTGDATSPNPPDALDTGQDVSDLLSSILRIDVDHRDPGKAYAVPKDNPFVKLSGARPEIWSFGFRNPWKMSFDRANGDLWVGDVGWELWEMVYRIKKGGNYGWSVMEGRQQVRPNAKVGPTPILPPAVDFPHTEAASITGGFVYRGKRFPDLVGSYICGDWVTGIVWACRFDGDKLLSKREIARTSLHIVSFAEDNAGELYILHYHETVGTLHHLVPNPEPDLSAQFPRKLSETGLLSNAPKHELAPGVIPFAVQAQQWQDHAAAERFLALPKLESVRMYDRALPIPGGFFSAAYFFPTDGVLAKTISLEMEAGNPASKRRLETQLLHYDGSNWHGYTYRWLDDQSDAVLSPSGGAEMTLDVRDKLAPGGKRKLVWRLHSQTECLQCHNPWAGYTLGFTYPQLNGKASGSASIGDQLAALRDAVYIRPLRKPGAEEKPGFPERIDVLCDPHDAAKPLGDRARSYLQANCAHCHQLGAGGTADIELRISVPLEKTKTVGVRPVQGTFSLANPSIIAPGDPFRSVLFYRVAKIGGGRMPHLGSSLVDDRGLRLLHDWILSLDSKKTGPALEEKLLANCRGASDAARRDEELGKLLATTRGAAMLAFECAQPQFPDGLRKTAVANASAHADPVVRDLFERFIPDEQRIKRLGAVIQPESILGLKGDAARGRELFLRSTVLQCVNCHKIGDEGSKLGPDLSHIGKKYTRSQLLESILDPSKSIDPQYVTFVLETKDGRVLTGLLTEKTAEEVRMRDAKDQELRVPANQVEQLITIKKSLMPELLVRDLTAAQLADLLEFLGSLK